MFPSTLISRGNFSSLPTLAIMDPYEIITWKVPGDAGGPKYLGL